MRMSWVLALVVLGGCGGSSSSVPDAGDHRDGGDDGGDGGSQSSTVLVVGAPIGTSDTVDGPVNATRYGLAPRGDHYLLSYIDENGAYVVNITADGHVMGAPTTLGTDAGRVACTEDGSCIVVSSTPEGELRRFRAVVISPMDTVVARLDLGLGEFAGTRTGHAAFASQNEFFVAHTLMGSGKTVVRIGTDGVIDGTPLSVDALFEGTCGNNSGCWVGVTGTNLIRLAADGSTRTAALPTNFRPYRVVCEDYGCLIANDVSVTTTGMTTVVGPQVARIAADDTIETPTYVGYGDPNDTFLSATGSVVHAASDSNGYLIYQVGANTVNGPHLTRIAKTGPITVSKVKTTVPLAGELACTAARCLFANDASSQPIQGYLLDGTTSSLIDNADHAPLSFYSVEQRHITFAKRPTTSWISWVVEGASLHVAVASPQITSVITQYTFPDGESAFGTDEGFVVFDRANARSLRMTLYNDGSYQLGPTTLTTAATQASDFMCSVGSCLFAYSTATDTYAQMTDGYGIPTGNPVRLAAASVSVRITLREADYVVVSNDAAVGHAQVVSATGALGASTSLEPMPTLASVGDKLLVPRPNVAGAFDLLSADFATSTQLALPTLGTSPSTLVGTASLDGATFVLMRSGDALYGFRIDTDGHAVDAATPIATISSAYPQDVAVAAGGDHQVHIGYAIDATNTWGTHARLRMLTVTTQPAP